MLKPCVAIAALLAFASACRQTPVSGPIDSEISVCIPGSATILAGADLVRLRASPLYGQLPATVRGLLDPMSEARSLVLASDGVNLLIAARGPFHQPPPGATVLGRDLVISATPDFLVA